MLRFKTNVKAEENMSGEILETIHKLQVEPMTEESFKPFGELIEVKSTPADERLFFPTEFKIDGRMTIDAIWQPYATRTFSLLERHFNVTQAFLPLGGPPSAVAVAPPTNPEDPDDTPEPDQLRAFLINPTKGFVYKTGTWHSLDRYLLTPPGAGFVILNVDPNPTQVVDYAESFNTKFEIVF